MLRMKIVQAESFNGCWNTRTVRRLTVGIVEGLTLNPVIHIVLDAAKPLVAAVCRPCTAETPELVAVQGTDGTAELVYHILDSMCLRLERGLIDAESRGDLPKHYASSPSCANSAHGIYLNDYN